MHINTKIHTYERNPKCHNRTSVKCAHSQFTRITEIIILIVVTDRVYYAIHNWTHLGFLLLLFFFFGKLEMQSDRPNIMVSASNWKINHLNIVIQRCRKQGTFFLSFFAFFFCLLSHFSFSNFPFRNVYIDCRHVLQLYKFARGFFFFCPFHFCHCIFPSILFFFSWYVFHPRDNHNQWKRNCVK